MAIRYEHISSQEPATKGDVEQLREDLQADIVRATETLATQDEVQQLRADMHAMESRLLMEITAGQQSFTQHLKDWGKMLFEKIDAAVEIRQIELGAAKTEQVEANTERLDRHEARISALERESRKSI